MLLFFKNILSVLVLYLLYVTALKLLFAPILFVAAQQNIDNTFQYNI